LILAYMVISISHSSFFSSLMSDMSASSEN
jgi:hypothetical protein